MVAFCSLCRLPVPPASPGDVLGPQNPWTSCSAAPTAADLPAGSSDGAGHLLALGLSGALCFFVPGNPAVRLQGFYRTSLIFVFVSLSPYPENFVFQLF